MPRYFFHIKDKAKTIREGMELQDLDAVLEELGKALARSKKRTSS